MSSSNNPFDANHHPHVAPVDENTDVMAYPAAQIVLIDEEDNGDVQQRNFSRLPNVHATQHNLGQQQQQHQDANDFASAQVVDPLAGQPSYTTETYATATPLDPWSKAPIATTDPAQTNNATRSPRTQSRQREPVQVVQAGDAIPVVSLEDPLHKKMRRRRRRRGRMALSGVAGFVVGSFLGPLGAILGAASGAAVARAASKAGERRKDKRIKRQLDRFQQQYQTQLEINRSQQVGRTGATYGRA